MKPEKGQVWESPLTGKRFTLLFFYQGIWTIKMLGERTSRTVKEENLLSGSCVFVSNEDTEAIKEPVKESRKPSATPSQEKRVENVRVGTDEIKAPVSIGISTNVSTRPKLFHPKQKHVTKVDRPKFNTIPSIPTSEAIRLLDSGRHPSPVPSDNVRPVGHNPIF